MDTPIKVKKVWDARQIKKALQNLSFSILEKNHQVDNLALLGIQTRGVYLAQRIRDIIKKNKEVEVPLGTLDITLYRDDLTSLGPKPIVKETKIHFDINDKVIILVDDVLFTGRTVRAALDEIVDFGRPKKVELAVLIDRGHRELPIQPDFVGGIIETEIDQMVEVRLKEVDKKEGVFILNK